MNWSSGLLRAINMARLRPLRRPARPACCQVLAIEPGYPAMMQASKLPISMPSSRALVLTTPMTSRVRRPLSISRRKFGK
jgi:hypothetical protein